MNDIGDILRRAVALTPEECEPIWQRVLAGDRDALNQLLSNSLGREIWVRCWYRAGPHGADVFQEVAAELHRQFRELPTYAEAVRRVRCRVYTVRSGAAQKDTRRKKHERTAGEQAGTDTSDGLSDAVLDVRNALERLDDEDRQLLSMRYFEGMDIKGIAAILEPKGGPKDRGTVSERLNRAEGRLARLLKDGYASAAVGGALVAAKEAVGLPPPLPARRLAELLAAAVRRATEAGPSFARFAAVTGTVLVAVGAAVAGYAYFRRPMPNPVPVPVVRPVPTVAEVNREAAEKDVVPDFLALLTKLALGKGGRAELVGPVQTFGTRVSLSVAIRHAEPLRFTTTLRVVIDTKSRRTRWTVDRWGTGDFQLVPPDRAIVLFPENYLKLGFSEVSLSLKDYRAAADVLQRLPTDPRGGQVLKETDEAIRSELRRLAGRWTKGGEGPHIVISVGEDGIDMRGAGVATQQETDCMWLDGVGQLQELFASGHRLSTDGNRIDFPNGEFWQRAEK